MQLLEKLSEHGPFAIILAISFLAIGILFTKYVEAQEKRLSDYKDSFEKVTKLLESIKSSTDSTLISTGTIASLLQQFPRRGK